MPKLPPRPVVARPIEPSTRECFKVLAIGLAAYIADQGTGPLSQALKLAMFGRLGAAEASAPAIAHRSTRPRAVAYARNPERARLTGSDSYFATRRAAYAKLAECTPYARDEEDLAELLVSVVRGAKTQIEESFVCFRDKKKRLTSVHLLARGDGTSVEFDVEEIDKLIGKHDPHSIIMAHVHPGESAESSDEDDEITQRFERRYSDLYSDHLIIAQDSDEVFSYARDGFFSVREDVAGDE
jgi:hypothetical protein